MVLEGEARHGVVRLRLQPRPAISGPRRERGPAPAGGLRQSGEMLGEGGDEHRLAGARQAGDAEAKAAPEEVIADRPGDQPRLEHEIAEAWQGKIRARTGETI